MNSGASIVRDTINRLKELTDCRLSGDDSELANAWEEICVQVQREVSFFWDSYLDTIRALLLAGVEAMDPAARHALWLETDGGWDWQYDHDDEVGSLAFNSDDIVEFLKGQVLRAAADYENDNIRLYLDGAIDEDDDPDDDDEEIERE